jgi:hypothetical protein
MPVCASHMSLSLEHEGEPRYPNTPFVAHFSTIITRLHHPVLSLAFFNQSNIRDWMKKRFSSACHATLNVGCELILNFASFP